MRYHADANNEPAKEVRSWNGIPLNITTKSGEPRFSFSPPMSCDYGCIRGSWGAGLDGKALDVYVVSNAPTVFKVVQITPAGAIDEYKYVLGAQNFDEAVETFLKHVPRQLFGAASQYSIAQLQDDMGLHSKVKKDANELAEFVEQLEALIESDDAYSSNVNVLSFIIDRSGDVTGKFQDAWNKRIFSYSVQENRIGYKPAIGTEKADSATESRFLDIFSLGYASLTPHYDAVKGGKKPRCTSISYGCGAICIPLQHTCWINSAGKETKRTGGSIESISQGRIDKIRALAKYLDSKGNNKWSRYGSANDLKAKANTLEKERAGMFKAGVKKQPPIDPLVTGLKKAFDSGNFAEAKILARQAASKMKSGEEVATYLQKLSEVVANKTQSLVNKKKKITKEANTILKTKGAAAAKDFYSENWDAKCEKLSKNVDSVISIVAREFLYVESSSKMKGGSGGVVNPDTGTKTGKLNEQQSIKIASGIDAFKKMVGVSSIDGKKLNVTVIDANSKKAGRSFYRGGSGTVYMAEKAPVEVVIHEAAHWLEESDPKIHGKIRDFFEKRTQGEPWQKLSKLTGNKNYRDDEVAKPDKWPKAYMGKKTKSDKNSEILSMGMEMMYKDPIGFAKTDPEYFAFIHNTLRGK